MRKRIRFAPVAVALLAGALALPAAGVSESSGSTWLTAVGPGEGQLNMVAWEGYLDKSWVAPFEKQSGCKVKPKYATSSDEMVTLMRSGGGGQYDLVSASGDASLRLIYGGDIAETNVKLVKPWQDFHAAFKSPLTNTARGKHYGISLQFGPKHPALQHRRRRRSRRRGRRSTTRPTRARSRSRTMQSRSPTRRCTSRRRSPELKNQGSVRARLEAVRRCDRAAQAAAAAARGKHWVLRVRPDRLVQERQVRRSVPRGRTSCRH